VAEAAVASRGSKPRFMLQVGSFPVRAEAEAFAATFAGQNPTVVAWELPGKGLWYRVRVGNFQTFKEAIDAKMVFEKKHNKIALVIGPL
jgi:cell division protein FtsN